MKLMRFVLQNALRGILAAYPTFNMREYLGLAEHDLGLLRSGNLERDDLRLRRVANRSFLDSETADVLNHLDDSRNDRRLRRYEQFRVLLK